MVDVSDFLFFYKFFKRCYILLLSANFRSLRFSSKRWTIWCSSLLGVNFEWYVIDGLMRIVLFSKYSLQNGSRSFIVDRTITARSDILIEFDKSVKWAAEILFLRNASLTILPDRYFWIIFFQLFAYVFEFSVDICWISGIFSSYLSREEMCLLLREFKLTIANIGISAFLNIILWMYSLFRNYSDDCQTIDLSLERGGVSFQLMRIILSKPFFDTCSSLSLVSEVGFQCFKRVEINVYIIFSQISSYYLLIRLPYPVMSDHHFPELSQCMMFIDDRERPKVSYHFTGIYINSAR